MKNCFSLFVLLAFLFAWAPARAEDAAHDCLVVVVDASGSMGDPLPDGQIKMDAAKSALKKVLDKVPPGTEIGVVVFSGRMRDDWIVPLAPRTPYLDDKIDGIRPGGSTPLGTYIKKGADALLAERERQYGNGRYRLLVVTDGAADSGREEEMMSAYAPDVVDRGIRLDVIGLGMEETHVLATMADSYQPAQNAGELDKALAKVVNVESSGSPQADADDLATVGGLPDDLAKAWVDAVTAPRGNWPIGESAPKPPTPAASSPTSPPSPTPVSSDQSSPICSVIGFGSMSALGVLLAAAIVRRRSFAG